MEQAVLHRAFSDVDVDSSSIVHCYSTQVIVFYLDGKPPLKQEINSSALDFLWSDNVACVCVVTSMEPGECAQQSVCNAGCFMHATRVFTIAALCYTVWQRLLS